jgi:hypothetical protein
MRFLFILCLWFIGAVPVSAAWTEAKSENFIFVGDVSEKRAKLIVSELEEYRSTIFNLFKWGAETELMPVRVYAVEDSKDIEDITGNEWASGIYTSSSEGPVFIISVKGGFRKNSPARNTAYHEYTHHLINMYSGGIYPQWYNEGMAEYLSTFDASNSKLIKIGLPNKYRSFALSRRQWLDTSLIVNSVRAYPWRNGGGNSAAIDQFYAQAWLATHYIQSHPEMTDKLVKYISLINSEFRPAQAFDKAFGMSPAEFETLLKKYYKDNRYMSLRVKLDEGYAPEAVTTRRLSKGERYFHFAEAIRRYGRNKQAYERAETYYQKSLAEDGPKAQIAASQALVALGLEKEDSAKTYAKTALAAAPDDPRVLHIAGHIGVHTFKDTGLNSSEAQLKKARKDLINAMKANPQNVQAHYDYVMSFFYSGQKLNAQAKASATEVLYYYRGRSFIDHNLPIAQLLLEAGEYEDALPVFQRATVWSDARSNRRMAEIHLEKALNTAP